MSHYSKPKLGIWTGRTSKQQLYLHEKVVCNEYIKPSEPTIVVLGYACEEGVKRNHGRIGAKAGPNIIKTFIGKMPNHLPSKVQFVDGGTVVCNDGAMEAAQKILSQKIARALKHNAFPIVVGGGHDIAYGHYTGLREHLGTDTSIGIINFDAHFDLRPNKHGNNSGTPFYQIAQDCSAKNLDFKYLCLGIRQDGNDRDSYQIAEDLGVEFIEANRFSLLYLDHVLNTIHHFADEVDFLYVSIDLDGFSSAYAPGVSSPSPMGFAPDIVLECLSAIIHSNKMISLDFAEMNPKYDMDNQTAKLAASLAHFVMHTIEIPS